MNILIENNTIEEIACGTNFAYILSDNTLFLPTEYKVLQSQKNGCFVKCMKMLYNGRVQLYYFSGEYKSLSALLPSLDSDSFLTIVSNLLYGILYVHNNGFLTCKNIDASFERAYVDPSTYKVSLIYLPLKKHLFDDNAAFENEIRTSLVKVLSGFPSLSSPKTMRLSKDLQNGSINIEELYSKLNGKNVSQQTRNGLRIHPQVSSASSGLKLIAMNSPERFELAVTKNEFVIGKKDTNDGVISFNKMISRVHCKITTSGNQYWISDLQSSNGTFINHVKLQPNQPYQLKNGDIVRLANSDFQAIIS